MEVELTTKAQEDLGYWKSTGNEKVLKRIRELICSINNDPFSGIGKPELLKYELSGKWSRRIDRRNRVVYSVKDNKVCYIYSLKGHYGR